MAFNLQQTELVVLSTKPVYRLDPRYIKYSDIAPDVKKELLTVNIDSVGVSIYNLLTTKFGERLNLPDYGVNLDDYLFEIMDSTTEDKILYEIYQAISAWEPRLKMDMGKSNISGDYEKHSYNLELYFYVTGLDNLLIKYCGSISRFSSLMSNAYK